MARKRPRLPGERGHRWYLAEWAKTLGKTQADAQRDLGWAKSTASYLWTNSQRYTQDSVDEVAEWLGIEPFELLMSPENANGLRDLRRTAAIVARHPALAHADKADLLNREELGKNKDHE